MAALLKFVAVCAALGVAVYVTFAGLLYFSQRSYIYYPVGRSALVPSMSLDREGTRLVISKNEVEASRAVLYFGGNAEDVSQAVGQLERAFPDSSIYAMHYRGYGGSAGEPSERALVADALALHDQVAPRYREILIVGRSLGSGIAVQLAAARPVSRLVLVTPFHSMAALAAQLYPWLPTRWLLRDKYDSARFAAQVSAPTTIIVAQQDEVIPPGSAMALSKAFPAGTEVRVIALEGAGHNTLSADERYWTALAGQH